ncbi:MAG: FHA domain-containing protein [Anaerolineaceae bacterium]|nr:FHA domain-containing protein [Anaerolineaceae bacterium]
MFRKRPRDESNESGQSKDLVRRGQGAEPPAPSTAPPLLASLEATSGPDKGQSFPLTRMITLIGRDETCDIVLADETVSREHGQIEQHMTDWVYTNLSDNGTWINRKKVERLVLKNGDTIEVGGETRMRFRLAKPDQVEVAPAVRRRARLRHDQEVEEEVEPHPRPQLAESLMRRRKLLVGIGVYLMVILAAVIIFTLSGKGDDNRSRGAVSEWKGPADIDAYLDFDFPDYQENQRQANKKLDEAYLLYQNWRHGNPMDLYNSVKAFRESYYYRGGSWLTFEHQRAYKRARTDLRDELWRLYNSALILEAQFHRAKAKDRYREILRRVDQNNPIYRHVERRLARLR